MRWLVKVSEFNKELASSDMVDAGRLYSRGVYEKEGSSSTSSHLVINVTQVNIVEYVECEALSDLNSTRSGRVNVTIFGIYCNYLLLTIIYCI